MTNWNSFEERVREISSLQFGRPAQPETIEHVRFDSVVRLVDGRIVLVEAITDIRPERIREGIAKHESVRLALFSKKIYPLCYLVTSEEPPGGMVASGLASNITVLSEESFEKHFFNRATYDHVRSRVPFGSAVHPESGEMAQNRFVPVNYYHSSASRAINIFEIADLLRAGRHVLLTGEYGTGKSRCMQELFPTLLRPLPGATHYPIPIAINLREQWGLRTAQEVIRRHFADLGISDFAENVIRALHTTAFCFLLDGFDEIGAQTWSENPAKIRHIRRESLQGVRDLVRRTSGAIFLSGRDHYFNSDDEAFESLGLDPHRTTVLKSFEEFSVEEMSAFIRSISSDVEMPVWLPRRPLVAQILSEISREDMEDLLAEESGEARFWDFFISAVCRRESLIRAGLESDSVRRILRRLSVVTRNRVGNTGPLTLNEIGDSFTTELGFPPVDESALILHRLPGLGRVQSDSNDRRFTDTYILDGLRAEHIATCSEDRSEAERVAHLHWCNPFARFWTATCRRSSEGERENLINLVFEPTFRKSW